MDINEAFEMAKKQNIEITNNQAQRISDDLWPLAEGKIKAMQVVGDQSNIPTPRIEIETEASGAVSLLLSIRIQ